MPRSLRAWLRGDLPVARLAAARNGCPDLLERLPADASRHAAWAAHALVTYGDKLVAAAKTDGYVDADTARVALASYDLAARGGTPLGLPRWPGGSRSEEQLRGMHDALDALRTFLAFELQGRSDARLETIDRRLKKVASLSIPRPTPEIRNGLADALVAGLDETYALGLAL